MGTEKRVIIVSDLHIGGEPAISNQHPFGDSLQIFHSAPALAAFLDGLETTQAGEPGVALELILNGDSIDFSAEGPLSPSAADVRPAVDRMETSLDRVPEVCGALDRFLDSHALTVIVGDCDIELSVPGVRSRLVEVLGARKDSIRFVLEGESCRIGRLLVEHGHRYAPAGRSPAGSSRVPRGMAGFMNLLRPVDATVARIQKLLGAQWQAPDDRPPLTGSDLARLLVLLRRKLCDRRPEEMGADVYQAAAERLLHDDGTDLVVFGHTHRALRVECAGGTYVNTGTWARRLSIPEACLAGTEEAMGQFRLYVDCLLNGAFEDWTAAQLTYADIRLTPGGEVVAAELCEFRDAALSGDPLLLSTS